MEPNKKGIIALFRGRQHINMPIKTTTTATAGLKTVPATPPPNLKFSGTTVAPRRVRTTLTYEDLKSDHTR